MFVIIPIPATVRWCPHCTAIIDRTGFIGSRGTRLASPMQKCKRCGFGYLDSRCKEWTHLSKSDRFLYKADKFVGALLRALLVPLGIGILGSFQPDLRSGWLLLGSYIIAAVLLVSMVKKKTHVQISLSVRRTTPPPLPASRLSTPTVRQVHVPPIPPSLRAGEC
jgi:hypothetical protein